MSRRAALIWVIVGGFMAGFALAATIGYYLAGISSWPTTTVGVLMGVGIIGMHWGDVNDAR